MHAVKVEIVNDIQFVRMMQQVLAQFPEHKFHTLDSLSIRVAFNGTTIQLPR